MKAKRLPPVGFALFDGGEELLSPGQFASAVRYRLPADLSPSLAPTLLPGDTVIMVPSYTESVSKNALVYVNLHMPYDGYIVGRFVAFDDEHVLLNTGKQDEPVRYTQQNVIGLWLIKFIVFRRVTFTDGKEVSGE